MNKQRAIESIDVNIDGIMSPNILLVGVSLLHQSEATPHPTEPPLRSLEDSQLPRRRYSTPTTRTRSLYGDLWGLLWRRYPLPYNRLPHAPCLHPHLLPVDWRWAYRNGSNTLANLIAHILYITLWDFFKPGRFFFKKNQL